MCNGKLILRYGFDLKLCDAVLGFNLNLGCLGQEYTLFFFFFLLLIRIHGNITYR